MTMRACLVFIAALIAAPAAAQSSPAQAWLHNWQARHVGSSQYRAPSGNTAGLPVSRIPRLVVVTVGSVAEALASRWRENFESFWKLSPEYAHMLLEDADCESFLAACCPPEELLAFRLVKSGTQKNNIFLISWLREIGGIVVDQDTALTKPLSASIPPTASNVAYWSYCSRSHIGCFEYGSMFAYEPGNPIWDFMSRIVVRNVLAQADFACRRSHRGCRGSYGCVVAMTAMGPYALALEELIERYNCRAPARCSDSDTSAECSKRMAESIRGKRGPNNDAICAAATHESLRRLVVLMPDEAPTQHSICHSKVGAKKQCVRPDESKTHYISNPAAGLKYYQTPQGELDGSSAPSYYHPRCSNDTSEFQRWTACDQARSHVAPKGVLESMCSVKDRVRVPAPSRALELPAGDASRKAPLQHEPLNGVVKHPSVLAARTQRRVALVTGITGQDGSYLTELLLSKGYEVHGIVRRTSSFNTHRIAALESSRLRLHYGDLADATNLLQIMTDVQPTEVYNLGAQSHVKTSFETSEYTADVDGLGVLRLLNAIRSSGLEKTTRFYQASTSELYGLVQEIPQKETTPFYPRSPYAVAKQYGYWIVVNYREGYGMHASNGILFNHESPRRGPTFVTRKITRAVARIHLGLQDVLTLGNIDATRDWGHARDYVEGMWRILQQPTPDDYVLATGKTVAVRKFVEAAFKAVNIQIEWRGKDAAEVGYGVNASDPSRTLVPRVRIDPKYYRPTEVQRLLGDPSKAKRVLGWEATTTVEQLCAEMVQADLRLVRTGDLTN